MFRFFGGDLNYSYFVHKNFRDGSLNRRFYKIYYTAALRFGVVLPITRDGIEISFDGVETSDVEAHDNNRALKGKLTLSGKIFQNVILIDRLNIEGRPPKIKTFWPESQHPDAHESYTDPLVDTAMDGTPYDIHLVATKMHEKFRENAGVSPATLMKVLYEQEAASLRERALTIGALLEESNTRERMALNLAEQKIQEARDLANDKERLEKKNSFLEDEVKRLELERVNSEKGNNNLFVAESDILLQVNENVMYRGSLCTELIFENSAPRYMKVATFDKDGSITAKASLLAKTKKRVKVTCWDPVNKPPKYFTSQGYFRNIYYVADK